MSDLRIGTWVMPAATLGPEDPLPQLGFVHGPHGKTKIDRSIKDEDTRYFGYGVVPGCLPYRLQAEYDRKRRPRAFRVAILENEILRATILLELGGRLWSLFHKPSNTELLYVNPVFQPGNLAVRNAWFSGGVEWNIGVRGHCPFTCSPLFAARVTGVDSCPVLRLYEFERIRGVPFQIDFSLPDGLPLLLVRVRIINPHDHDTPMYWWSNAAVPETPKSRVIVPAVAACRFSYRGDIDRTTVPIADGVDDMYPVNSRRARDDFYIVQDEHRPWITSVDEHGRGLVLVSTPRLKGRKLFRWGTHAGGRHWPEFLSGGGPPYIEIQGGITRTQAECIPMPPKAEWDWLEAYGLVETDPRVVHGTDWDAAVNAVRTRLDEMVPDKFLPEMLERTRAVAEREPEELIQAGSGWGALERRRRERAGEPPLCSHALPFPDSTLGPEQEPWFSLLEDGALPDRAPGEEPGAWMVQPEWRTLLRNAVRASRGAHWLSWLHLGVMACYAGRARAARFAWEKSLSLAPSAWAYRNLALLAARRKRFAESADLYLRARELAPELRSLTLEVLRALIRAGRAADVIRLMPNIPEEVRKHPRIMATEAKAALELGDLEKVGKFLASDVEMADVREGELSLSDLWFGMHARRIAAAEGIAVDDALLDRVRVECPPPYHIDFRMAAEQVRTEAGEGAGKERNRRASGSGRRRGG